MKRVLIMPLMTSWSESWSGSDLQLIAFFYLFYRKLCILKGIYPREPRKKPQGANKTYYFLKDIQFMLHDPIIPVLREQRSWKKKLKRAIAKQDNVKAEMLRANRPMYTLNHLIKERYPTFVDAIRDLDDALCLLHLVSTSTIWYYHRSLLMRTIVRYYARQRHRVSRSDPTVPRPVPRLPILRHQDQRAAQSVFVD